MPRAWLSWYKAHPALPLPPQDELLKAQARSEAEGGGEGGGGSSDSSGSDGGLPDLSEDDGSTPPFSWRELGAFCGSGLLMSVAYLVRGARVLRMRPCGGHGLPTPTPKAPRRRTSQLPSTGCCHSS